MRYQVQFWSVAAGGEWLVLSEWGNLSDALREAREIANNDPDNRVVIYDLQRNELTFVCR